MGVYRWNNMGNLFEETVKNRTADLIIHAGDHCYKCAAGPSCRLRGSNAACNGSEGDADERRADGCKSSRCSLLRFHKPDEAVAQTCKPSSKRWPTRSGCLL